ncbi:MAG: DEAD/DEAH box helicase [Solobacterium sp.]|nr:DEAD/DEAH box helicase [Solobacterium sp.]
MAFSIETLERNTLQKALREMNIETLSEVQAECIPEILAGRNVRITAPTGSGKTLTYLLPLLDRMEIQKSGKHLPVLLILVPTRELALQTADICRSCLKYTEGIRTAVLTGGVSIDAQIRSFRSGADIVIATPARLLDHIRRHTFKPKQMRDVIIDEADRMAEMGFLEDVQTVMRQLPPVRTVCLSATEDERLEILAGEFFPDAVMHRIEETSLLKQEFTFRILHLAPKDKNSAAYHILKEHRSSAVVFCNSRRTADSLTAWLQKRGIHADVLHSEMDPAVRKKTMQKYRSGELPVIVATDVLSRGIDVASTGLVLLYDLPESLNDLIHRIGRTARASRKGLVWVLQTAKHSAVWEAYAESTHPVYEEYEWNPK